MPHFKPKSEEENYNLTLNLELLSAQEERELATRRRDGQVTLAGLVYENAPALLHSMGATLDEDCEEEDVEERSGKAYEAFKKSIRGLKSQEARAERVYQFCNNGLGWGNFRTLVGVYRANLEKNAAPGKHGAKSARSLLYEVEDAWEEWHAPRKELVESNLGLVRSQAFSFFGKKVAPIELFQEGVLGLMRAADKFEYLKGRFSTYAVPWINTFIERYLARHTASVDTPKNETLGLSYLGFIEHDLRHKFRRDPTNEEIVEAMLLGKKTFRRHTKKKKPTADDFGKKLDFVLKQRDIIEAAAPISMDAEINSEEGDQTYLDHFSYEAGSWGTPESIEALAEDGRTRDIFREISRVLNPMEQKIIMDVVLNEMPLEDSGSEVNLSRERIRQIKVGALGKLRRTWELYYGKR